MIRWIPSLGGHLVSKHKLGGRSLVERLAVRAIASIPLIAVVSSQAEPLTLEESPAHVAVMVGVLPESLAVSGVTAEQADAMLVALDNDNEMASRLQDSFDDLVNARDSLVEYKQLIRVVGATVIRNVELENRKSQVESSSAIYLEVCQQIRSSIIDRVNEYSGASTAETLTRVVDRASFSVPIKFKTIDENFSISWWKHLSHLIAAERAGVVLSMQEREHLAQVRSMPTVLVAENHLIGNLAQIKRVFSRHSVE